MYRGPRRNTPERGRSTLLYHPPRARGDPVLSFLCTYTAGTPSPRTRRPSVAHDPRYRIAVNPPRARGDPVATSGDMRTIEAPSPPTRGPSIWACLLPPITIGTLFGSRLCPETSDNRHTSTYALWVSACAGMVGRFATGRRVLRLGPRRRKEVSTSSKIRLRSCLRVPACAGMVLEKWTLLENCTGMDYLLLMSQYSRLSAMASQLASIILAELPTVVHSSSPSVQAIRTLTWASVPAFSSRMRTL